jgi:putative heme-binding domain-containing protein
VQLLCEAGAPPPRAIETFAKMARDDRSAVVRLYLASALQRIDRGARWTIARELMMRPEDATDHNLPTMVWLGIEPVVTANPSLALELAGRSGLPQVARHIARRIVESDAPGALERVVDAVAAAPRTTLNLLEGMRDGLEGRFDLSAPSNWVPMRARLSRAGGEGAALAREISQLFGDTETARRNIESLKKRTAPLDERRRALLALAGQRRPELARELPSVVDDPALRIDAIRAVAAFDDPALGSLLIDRYPSFSPAERAEAVQTLASRTRYGRLLTDALAKAIVPRSDIPPYTSRQLLRVVGTRFLKVWGPVELSATEERAHARYRRLLDDEALRSANVRNGRAVFQKSCGACHKLYGEGGAIGPDLTGSNRSNLDYLLTNVLDPNGEIQEAYKMVVVTTRDGRTYSGTIAAETDRQLTLRVIGRDAAVIPKRDIQTREVTPVSMMPPGLFDALSDPEVIDLTAYLRTAEPVKP